MIFMMMASFMIVFLNGYDMTLVDFLRYTPSIFAKALYIRILCISRNRIVGILSQARNSIQLTVMICCFDFHSISTTFPLLDAK
jgi:hypothetical protein